MTWGYREYLSTTAAGTYIDGEGRKASGYEKMMAILPSLVLVGALLIPFIYRQRFRDSSNRAALWLKPHGDGFIFHPFGKLGKAYRVSAAARDLIMARLTTRTKIFYCVLLVAIMPSLALASLDPTDFRRAAALPFHRAHCRPPPGTLGDVDLASASNPPALCRRAGIERTHLNGRSELEEGKLYIVDHHIPDDCSSWPRGLRIGVVRRQHPPSPLRVACRAHHPHPCRANDPALVFQAENQNRRLIGPAEVEIVD